MSLDEHGVCPSTSCAQGGALECAPALPRLHSFLRGDPRPRRLPAATGGRLRRAQAGEGREREGRGERRRGRKEGEGREGVQRRSAGLSREPRTMGGWEGRATAVGGWPRRIKGRPLHPEEASAHIFVVYEELRRIELFGPFCGGSFSEVPKSAPKCPLTFSWWLCSLSRAGEGARAQESGGGRY